MRQVVYMAHDDETARRCAEWMREMAPTAWRTLLTRPVETGKGKRAVIQYELSVDTDVAGGLLVQGLMIGAVFGYQRRSAEQDVIEEEFAEEEARRAKAQRRDLEHAGSERGEGRGSLGYAVDLQNILTAGASLLGAQIRAGVTSGGHRAPTRRDEREVVELDERVRVTREAPTPAKGKRGAKPKAPPKVTVLPPSRQLPSPQENLLAQDLEATFEE